jgi:hypothetical protein
MERKILNKQDPWLTPFMPRGFQTDETKISSCSIEKIIYIPQEHKP